MAGLLATRVALSAFMTFAACTAGSDAPGSARSDTQAAQSGAAPPAEASIATAQTESFERFWQAFRQAILAGDRNTIAAVTRFPFETRGPSDDDPVGKRDRAGFPALLDSLLAQESGMGDSETTRQFIERTTTLTERNVAPGAKEARVGDFFFVNTDGRWWFARAYTDE